MQRAGRTIWRGSPSNWLPQRRCLAEEAWKIKELEEAWKIKELPKRSVAFPRYRRLLAGDCSGERWED
jgi:hypothetical protein